MRAFDLQTNTWSILKTYGKQPASLGGQSVPLVGTSLVIFGRQDAKRSPGVPPSPCSDHAVAVHAERYLFIFGGGFTRYLPTQQGDIPAPTVGHAGVTIGENWFIVGGGDSKSGVSETIVLNMSTFVWSVVTTVEGRVPVASEGLSLVVSTYNGEDVIVSFGEYNGRYNNEVNVLKPSHKPTLPVKAIESPLPDSVSAAHNATNATRDLESEVEAVPDGRRDFVVDNIEKDPRKSRNGGTAEHLLATLKAEKEELESSLNKEKLSLQLRQEISEAETRNTDLYKVDVAELKQKLQMMETLQKELELLQRQEAASEQAALMAKQKQNSGGMWTWITGTPPSLKLDGV
ncbi:hypothetical protein EUGRSUZ_L02127 [Eucalyptus grandis]|uniref:Acyl-CoA-binding domain-containing protein n=1 Tax=Eucalyptus grandis TaxID=71139 RepID=A0A058ZTP1_EUCGR|nr:hypothetical protein EUGRSUZ_L02127 [Eucalyptus grandis]